MIVEFKIDVAPHPEPSHLGSRVRNLGRIISYEETRIIFTTDPEKVDDLTREVKKYCESRHSEILDVKSYFDFEIFSGRIQ